jgi:hypothetical protein
MNKAWLRNVSKHVKKLSKLVEKTKQITLWLQSNFSINNLNCETGQKKKRLLRTPFYQILILISIIKNLFFLFLEHSQESVTHTTKTKTWKTP